jgi:hypothetical protein
VVVRERVCFFGMGGIPFLDRTFPGKKEQHPPERLPVSQAAILSLFALWLNCLVVVPPFSGDNMTRWVTSFERRWQNQEGQSKLNALTPGFHLPSRLTRTWPSNRPSMEHAQHLSDLSVLYLSWMVEHAQHRSMTDAWTHLLQRASPRTLPCHPHYGCRWFLLGAEPFMSLLLYVIDACPVKRHHRRLCAL